MYKWKEGDYAWTCSLIRGSLFYPIQWDAVEAGNSKALPIYFDVADTLFELTNLTEIEAAYVQRNLSTDLESDLPS